MWAPPLSTPDDLYSFTPGRGRGRAVQGAVSRRLGGSLRHIYGRARQVADLPEGMVDPLVGALASGRPAKPEAFAIHSDILQAVGADDVEAVRLLFLELAAGSFLHDALVVRPLDLSAFSPQSRERYLR